MRIPNDALCKLMVAEINSEPEAFSPWLAEFADSNTQREQFTDAQKEALQRAADHYEFDCLKGYK